MKFRAGYGEAGIQPGAFQRFPVLNTANLGSNSVFVSPITTPNTNLSVELSKETEYGADLGLNLLNGSWLRTANVSATYWKRQTDNAIYSVDAAPSTGVGGTLDNAFGLASNGIQASLKTQDCPDLAEVMALVEKSQIPMNRVILMPEGRNVAEIDKVAPWLAERCRDLGVRMSDRLHVRLWGDKRGV